MTPAFKFKLVASRNPDLQSTSVTDKSVCSYNIT